MPRDVASCLIGDPEVGRVADGVVAERHGISRKTVLAWRKRNGIPAWDDPRRVEGAAGEAAPGGGRAAGVARGARAAGEGAAGDAAGGARTAGHAAGGGSGASTGSGRRAKPSRLDAFAHLLGTLSDRALAEKAGVSTENVRMYRQRRGIVAEWRAAAPAPTKVESALAAVAQELGRVPDAVIAQRVGVSRSAVTQYRARHGIPSGAREPAPVPTARVGFEVTVRGRSGDETVTVIAADAAAAAVTAAALGEVLALRRIGRVV